MGSTPAGCAYIQGYLLSIDPEYQGYEAEIKNTVMILCRKIGIKVRKKQINFIRLQKNSLAKYMASRIYKGVSALDAIISADEIIREIE